MATIIKPASPDAGAAAGPETVRETVAAIAP
jgi:hypothetical protein